MSRKNWLVGLCAWFALASFVPAAEKLKVLIIDGRNNHNWKATTPILEKALISSGRFSVDVATAGKDIAGFRPKFSAYDVVLSNYNDPRQLWSEATRKDFVDYVHGGGGFVVVHAANNSFTGWKEYNDMIGLGWRNAGFGDRVTFNDEGKQQRTKKGEGRGAGHGSQHEFQIVIRDREHPITKGLPASWMHAKDELYHGQRGPARDMTILATAYSDKSKRGTSAHEPMMWTIPYGKGRVYTTVMGHAPLSMKCVGFITTLRRGTEWAATGKVTLTEVPKDFPTAKKVSLRE